MSALLKFPTQKSVDPLPDKEQILKYLGSSLNPVSDVFLAAQFDTDCPRMRLLLKELEEEGAIVGNDGEWRIKSTSGIVIDPEFKKLIPPLSPQERSQLEENLLAEGCREPLVIWKGQNILLDGHNRYEICDRYGIEFSLIEIELEDRAAASNWIIRNQLGRRNLTPEAVSYFRGKLYNGLKAVVKNPVGNNQHSEVRGQNVTKPKTAERLADELKVNPRTIMRDGQYATAVDTLAEVVGEEVRPQLLSRDTPLTKKKTLQLATDAVDNPNKVKRFFDPDGNRKDIVELIKERKPVPFPYRVGEVCQIIVKGHPELKGKSGCWAIVTKVYEHSCDLLLWNGKAQLITPEHLKRQDFDQRGREEIQRLWDRLQRLRETGKLSAIAIANLEALGRIDRPFLTEEEELLLSTLERFYELTPSR